MLTGCQLSLFLASASKWPPQSLAVCHFTLIAQKTKVSSEKEGSLYVKGPFLCRPASAGGGGCGQLQHEGHTSAIVIVCMLKELHACCFEPLLHLFSCTCGVVHLLTCHARVNTLALHRITHMSLCRCEKLRDSM